MIVFDLRCRPIGHVFEAWFGSSGDYESQRDRGLVQCPLCGAEDIEKAMMAPRVGAKGNQAPAPVPAPARRDMLASDPADVKTMLATMAAMQKKMLEKADYVGTRFADEARAIHLGEREARSIYGKATSAETQSLADEGIEVAPLPFPFVLPGEEN
ncbi:MAG: hypothetical protein JWN69_2404 [Alphaproteobacteria bacterium]|nr:hypothetical protein [Alphaproteobacteria bacterium]